LTYPLASAGCLKDRVSGVSRLAFTDKFSVAKPLKGFHKNSSIKTTVAITQSPPLLGDFVAKRGLYPREGDAVANGESWMAKPSMASAAASFVLRDLSILFHPHAPRQNPSVIFAKKLEELKSDSGVWGGKALVGREEVRGMKGVGVLSRVPTFARPLLGARFSVSGRLRGKDMASTVWASGGRLPRSWVSPKVNEDLLLAAWKEKGVHGPKRDKVTQLVTKGSDYAVTTQKGVVGLPESKAEMARLRSGGGLSYAAGTVATRYGSLGLKVWLFF
jgi:hypothetical protein